MRTLGGTAEPEVVGGGGPASGAVRRRGLGLSTLTCLPCTMESVPTDHRVIVGDEWGHGHQVMSQWLPQREFIKQDQSLGGYSYLLLVCSGLSYQRRQLRAAEAVMGQEGISQRSASHVCVLGSHASLQTSLSLPQ